jgi:hypothetical protein
MSHRFDGTAVGEITGTARREAENRPGSSMPILSQADSSTEHRKESLTAERLCMNKKTTERHLPI